MPTYLYRRVDNDQIVEVTMTISEMQRRQRGGSIVLRVDGKRVKAVRELAGEVAQQGGQSTAWPMKSRAAGVNKHQIGAAAADLAKAGIPTDFTSDGEAVFRDRKHRSRVLQHLGMYDHNAGYGDRSPGQRIN
jgi:hypothetical protein